MNLKEWGVVGVAALALVVGFMGWSKPAIIVDSTKVDINAISSGIYDAVVSRMSSLGAVSVLTSPQEWNGVTTINENRRFAPGTSTVVSLPVNASSTLAVICKGGGLSFAQEYEIAVGATPNATTTSLGKLFVPANRTAFVVASTSGRTFSENSKEFINLKMATTSGTTVSTSLTPTGSCSFQGIAI